MKYGSLLIIQMVITRTIPHWKYKAAGDAFEARIVAWEALHNAVSDLHAMLKNVSGPTDFCFALGYRKNAIPVPTSNKC